MNTVDAGMAVSTSLLHEFDARCERDVALGPLTWYGIGGCAEVVAHPASFDQLSTLVARCGDSDTPVYVLGSGANLLVADQGVRGVVVRLDDPHFKQIRVYGNTVTVGAGFDLAKLVLQAAKAGLAGVGCLAGIPASVGGAVRMNAGGVYGQIGPSVCRVTVCDAFGQIQDLRQDELSFGYRTTNIQAPYILEVELDLTPDDPVRLVQQVKGIFAYKKKSQPLGDSSAGCVFKNPKPPSGQGVVVPVSAGQLIDRSGLKGFRIGGAEVSSRHANFIVTHGGCTAADVLALMEHIQKAVWYRFAVLLEREVVVWP